ncbi:MAG: pseudouridine synthase [bacterium]
MLKSKQITSNMVRLHKAMADAGVASRREAEELIREGLVTVNGKVITDLGTQVDPEHCHIKVRGKLIQSQQKKVYLALNKPAGYVTTLKDPQNRPTIMEFTRGIKARVFPVGRLDYNSEGLIILTNDGELANEIMHPSHHMPKTYLVKLKGKPAPSKLEKLQRGIRLIEGPTAPALIRKVRSLPANTFLEITIHEGRKRQIRRMFEKIGHSVLKLKRIRIGPVYLGDLPLGKFRRLDPSEIKLLKTWGVKEKN